MASVVVTGGAGKLGRACVDELIRHGWDVIVFDRAAPPSQSGAVFVPIDLTDYGQVLDAMLGVEDRYARPDALLHQHRVGVERNGVGAAVRHPAAVRPRGRGIPAPARVHLFSGQDA